MIFYVRYLIYFIQSLLFRTYGMLQFIGKPGSRYLMPIAIAGIFYALRPYIDPYSNEWARVIDTTFFSVARPVVRDVVDVPAVTNWITNRVRQAYYGYQAEPWMLTVMLISYIVAVSLLYVVFSKILNLVLGTFPPVTRPLPPLRRLRATSHEITAAVVRVVVPPLRF